MKKIRRFKISEHTKEIARRIKKAGISLESLSIASQADLQKWTVDLLNETDPAVVYASFDKELPSTDKLFDVSSAAVITLGTKLSDKINSLTDDELKKAAQICVFEFLDTAFDFVTNLIREEAQNDNFQILPARLLHLPEGGNYSKADTGAARFARKSEIMTDDEKVNILPVVIEKLDISKISVSYTDGLIAPQHTLVFLVPWARKRRRK